MKQKSNWKFDIPLRILSLVLAVVLWIFAMDEENPTKYRWFNTIPVRITGTSKMPDGSELTVIEGKDNMIDVQIMGPNKTVTAVTSNQISAAVDISELNTPGEYDLPVNVVVNRMGVEAATSDPAKVHLRVDKMETKVIPIELNLEGTPSNGFRAGRPTSRTETVTIEGPSAELGEVKKACITLDVSGKNSTITDEECTVKLCSDTGEEITSPFIVSKTEKIKVSVSILKINTLPLTVTLKDGGTVRANQAKWKIEPENIQVVADDSSEIAQMQALSLGEIDLGSVRTGVPIEMPINMPDGVRLDAGQPKTARVTITIEGISTRQLQVTKFVPTDTANDQTPYTVSVETKSVDIELRGDKEALQKVDEDSFSIGLTFNSMSLGEGQHTVRGVITAIGLPTGVTLVEENVQVTIRITSDEAKAQQAAYNTEKEEE